MNRRYGVVVLLLFLLVAVMPACAGDKIQTYPTETQLSRDPIIESSFVYKEESKADIKDKSPVIINITPFLSSGEKLTRKIHEKELPFNQVVTNLVEHVNNGVRKTKIVQVYPESTLEMSDDAETIKQTTPGNLKLEMYYGYQHSVMQPWSKYYKIEKCDALKCRVVTADFRTRVVTVREIPIDRANAITGIPEYGALP